MATRHQVTSEQETAVKQLMTQVARRPRRSRAHSVIVRHATETDANREFCATSGCGQGHSVVFIRSSCFHDFTRDLREARRDLGDNPRDDEDGTLANRAESVG